MVISQRELEYGDFDYYYVDSSDYYHHEFKVILVLNEAEAAAA